MLHLRPYRRGQTGSTRARQEDSGDLAGGEQEADTPKTLIYTSGVWLYGNTGDRLVDETEPLNRSCTLPTGLLTKKLCLIPPE